MTILKMDKGKTQIDQWIRKLMTILKVLHLRGDIIDCKCQEKKVEENCIDASIQGVE